ncbi:hypothetical protein [Rhodococcus ruber]|uniref:phage upper tail fiber protein n=1 Tax=Rhodococcus ruber TaxID=1830 RepID=UPI0037847320
MGTLQPAKYGKVVGRLLAVVGDGPDEDEFPVAGGYPDAVPLQGSVTFTPRASTILVAGATPSPVTAFPAAITAQLDENGYLTLNGKRGVFLLCPGPETNPTSFTYRVRYSLTLDGKPVAAPEFDIEIVEYVPGATPGDPDTGSTAVDLAVVTPVVQSPGVAITRGPAGDSVESITLSGDGLSLVFHMQRETGPVDETVAIPSLASASTAAATATTAAATATTEANRAYSEAERAQTIVDQAAAGVVPDNSVTSAKIVDGAIVNADVNAAAAIAQSKIAGLVDDLAGKAPSSHTHTATAISDSTAVGRGVLTAATQSAARDAIGAGTSSLTIGTAAGTACAGNDARLSDQRVPTDNSVTSAKIVDGTIGDAEISASAGIALSKLATGRVSGSDNAGARTLAIWVGTEAQYTAIGTKDPNTLYFRTA